MKGKGASQEEAIRTQRDISFKIIAFGSIITLIIIFLFFYFGVMQFNLIHTVVGILLVAIIAFLFTTVAANAIAIVGSNPVSGMTLMTLILASVVMVGVGLKGIRVCWQHCLWVVLYVQPCSSGRFVYHRPEDWVTGSVPHLRSRKRGSSLAPLYRQQPLQV